MRSTFCDPAQLADDFCDARAAQKFRKLGAKRNGVLIVNFQAIGVSIAGRRTHLHFRFGSRPVI
jgi:hypothetical protein